MEGSALSFLEHLDELRHRVIVSVLVLAFAVVLSYPLAGDLISLMQKDLFSGVNAANFVVIGPMEAVSVKVKASILIACVATSPLLFYELYAFVGPALSEREKKLLFRSFLPAFLLFLVGVVFAYKIMLPMTIGFLIAEAAPIATPMLSLGETYDFIMFILFSTGLSFELPLAVAVLSKVGLVNHKILSQYRRHVIVLIFLVAGIVTPDPTFFSQIILAIPLVLLYEASLWVSRIVK